MQERLAHLGFKIGTIDGIAGPATTHAAIEFQKKYKYPAESTVTAQTAAQLAIEAPRVSKIPDPAEYIQSTVKREFSDICGVPILREYEVTGYDQELLAIFLNADVGCVSGISRFSISGNYRGFGMHQDALGKWHAQIIGKGLQPK